MTNDPRKDPAGPDDQERQEPIKDKPAGDPGEMLELTAEELQEHVNSAVKEQLSGKMGDFMQDFKKALHASMSPALQLSKNREGGEAGNRIQQYIESAILKISKNKDMPEYMPELIRAYMQTDFWAVLVEELKAFEQFGNEVKELEPYLAKELKKKKYGGKDLDTLFAEVPTDENGEAAAKSLFAEAITAARAARDRAENAPHATAKRAKTVEYPLDKPNKYIWNLLEEDTEGQIKFNLAAFGSKQQVPAYYSINFDDLGDDVQITRRLTPFDKLAYIAIAALFNAGNNVISLSQIYYGMGYTGRPGAKDLTRINDTITKMTAARITFDNEQEAAQYKYARFKYDGSLLPLERGTALINGQLADAAIHIFREPPLITFAKQRKQITTLDIKLLQAPVSKTDANLQIQDYLLERISKAKAGRGRSCRVLFKTLYSHTGIEDKPKTNTEKQRRKRAPEKVKKYLTHFQSKGFIRSYSVEPDGVTIHW